MPVALPLPCRAARLMIPKRGASLILLALLLTSLSACKNDAQQKSEEDARALNATPVSGERRDEQGLIVRTYDHDNDGLAEVTRYVEEVPDPDFPDEIVERLKKMEIDVNSDGRINVVRSYTLTGKLEQERLDQDLDGVVDVISYYDRGALSKKEVLKPQSEQVDYTRYYAKDTLLRVERDTTGDGKVDYWEFYEQGVLTRIGRDFNADGRADSWQNR